MLRFAPRWAALAGLLLLGSPAPATVSSGGASAFGLQIELTGLLNQSVGPAPTAAVASPPAASVSNDLADLSALSPLVTSGSAVVNASTDVDGGSGSRTASADAILEDAGVGLSVSIILQSLSLQITADEIFSSASVSGNTGSLVGTGSATFTNTFITLNGNSFGIDSEDFDTPNSEFLPGVFNPLGITIILNEQIFGGDGFDARSILVNAMRIEFDPLLGLLGGEMTFSQSQAELFAPVPEPGTAGLAALGLLGLALARRGRR